MASQIAALWMPWKRLRVLTWWCFCTWKSGQTSIVSFFLDILLGPVFFCPPNIEKAKWKGHLVPVVGVELQVLNGVGSVETMVGAA